MTTVSKTSSKAPAYENNPFFVAVNGLELLFNKAKAVGILLAVIAGLSAFSSLPGAFVPPAPASKETTTASERADMQRFAENIAAIPMEVWVLIALVALGVIAILLLIGIVFQGIIDYTSAQLSRGKEVSLSEAFHAVFANFWGYTWVLIVAGVKTFLWTLLFIIPGIIMAIRYSLAGVAYFDKKLSGNASVMESSRLTKNAWLTTFASHSLLNILTLGIIEALLAPGTRAVLYRQLKGYDTAGVQKPAAHVLSWLTLIVPIVLFVLIVTAVVYIAALLSTPKF